MARLLRGASLSYQADPDTVEILEARLTQSELHLSYEEDREMKSLTATSCDGINFVGTWSSRGSGNAPEGEVNLKLVRGHAGEMVLYGSWHEFGKNVGGWIIELREK